MTQKKPKAANSNNREFSVRPWPGSDGLALTEHYGCELARLIVASCNAVLAAAKSDCNAQNGYDKTEEELPRNIIDCGLLMLRYSNAMLRYSDVTVYSSLCCNEAVQRRIEMADQATATLAEVFGLVGDTCVPAHEDIMSVVIT